MYTQQPVQKRQTITVPINEDYYELHTYNEHDLICEERYMHKRDGCIGYVHRTFERVRGKTIVTINKAVSFPYTLEGSTEEEVITVSAEYIREAGKQILHSPNLKQFAKRGISSHMKRTRKFLGTSPDGEYLFSDWETEFIKLNIGK